ncbi:MAG: hypothetical protein LBQ54_02250 [Planctomycetaceae bacterium]|jgi:hypothetical protein|nr:hypothetical protein [Planctomycetaceae bacterium]
MSTTGTLLTTNISPSKPLVNNGVRAIFGVYAPTSGGGGTYTADLTKNFLYGLTAEDISVGETTYDQIELSLSAIQGLTKRFLEGEKTGGDITINFKPDPGIILRDPPPIPMEDGLKMEPHGVLWIGFLSSTDTTILIPYIEAPVNIKGKDGLTWTKNTEMTSAITFGQTGDGLRLGRANINKQLDYTAPV